MNTVSFKIITHAQFLVRDSVVYFFFCKTCIKDLTRNTVFDLMQLIIRNI